MAMTHELGHVVAGLCCGGTLKQADILPWHLPFSIFDPDPYPLITLWSGPILGAFVPCLVAALVRHVWMWFVANFCLLANGAYLAAAWLTGDRFLDTARLLENGASSVSLAIYCIVTIGIGYVGFRRSCLAVLFSEPKTKSNLNSDHS